jgi:hypothetical protein
MGFFLKENVNLLKIEIIPLRSLQLSRTTIANRLIESLKPKPPPTISTLSSSENFRVTNFVLVLFCLDYLELPVTLNQDR